MERMINSDATNAGAPLTDLCKQLMSEVQRSYSEQQKLSDELLSSLHFVFQGPLSSALELVEKSSVTHIESPSGRALFQVIGTSGTPYTCFPNLRYCSCPAYNFSVLRKEDHLMCKHVLAIQLSEAMGRSKKQSVSDAEIGNMIKEID
ncbi:zinc finger SWIM domain-containing protein 7 [Aplysia californica]|uniref:Zinc finger SWIM domain-containing protein 7 n=1 Tax=Aplysia californica TaxID=6500 RepID=A0ABM1ACX4_APLCA|nr:zinc finger SWIM domain-containing protein 7 [Aplysia californica]